MASSLLGPLTCLNRLRVDNYPAELDSGDVFWISGDCIEFYGSHVLVLAITCRRNQNQAKHSLYCSAEIFVSKGRPRWWSCSGKIIETSLLPPTLPFNTPLDPNVEFFVYWSSERVFTVQIFIGFLDSTTTISLKVGLAPVNSSSFHLTKTRTIKLLPLCTCECAVAFVPCRSFCAASFYLCDKDTI